MSKQSWLKILAELRLGRRGLSQSVATLIMLAIVIGAFVVAYPIVRNYVSAYRVGPAEKMQERFIIEDVWFHNNGTITIHLVNTGNIPIKVVKLFVDSKEIPITPTQLELGLKADGSITGNAASQPTIWDGVKWVFYTYKVEVATDRGVYVGAYYTVSQI